jgi:fibronectin type 3 domain-containing protein
MFVVTGLTVTDSSAANITISWDSINEAASYKVYRGDAIMGIPSIIDTPEVIGTSVSTSYTDSTVWPNSSYYYQVSAVFPGGAESPVSLLLGFVSGTSMSAPTLQVTGSTANSISLSWNNIGVTHYYVYRSDSSDGEYESITKWGTTNTSYTDSGLSPNTTYYYKVAGEVSFVPTGPKSAYVQGTTSTP